MAIDLNTQEGKDFKRLGEALVKRYWEIEILDSYVRGEPPLPESMAQLREQVADFFNTSRTNFAELVVEAPRERMQPVGIRTAVDNDEDGDAAGWLQWTNANLPIVAADVHQSMLALGDGYVIVSFDKKKQRPVATAEDPRQVITLHDPLTDDVTLALKLYHDQDAGQDVAFMYRPGQVFVATKVHTETAAKLRSFNAADWTWDPERSAPLPPGFEDIMPVVRFKNRGTTPLGRGVGEFERHRDVLDRINRTMLRGLVIMTYQAFKQRAVQGDLPEKDDDGNVIDYNAVLKAGPDALWLLPPETKIWESGQVSMEPIIAFAKNDVLFLAAVTRTPLAMLTPDAASQSAEGAGLQREGLVFKTEDRIARATHSWRQVMSLIFRYLGDTARADIGAMELMWAPVQRYSLSEMANAVAQTRGVVSRREQLIRFVGMRPGEADRALTELTDDLILDQQYAIGFKAASTPNNVVTRASVARPGEQTNGNVQQQ